MLSPHPAIPAMACNRPPRPGRWIMAPGMKYGLLAAVGMTAWLFCAYALGFHGAHIALAQYVEWGSAVILVVTLWRMLRWQVLAPERRWLPVWVGLLQGLYTSLVAALGFYIAYALYLRFVHPDYPDLYLEWRVAQMRTSGVAEENIRTMAREYRWSMGPIGLPLTLIAFQLLVGFFASPILTLWLNFRREKLGFTR